jgi:hypothetical protein
MPQASEGHVEVLDQISTKTEESGKSTGYGRAVRLPTDDEPASNTGVDASEEDVSEPDDEDDTETQSKKGQASDDDSDDESEDQESDEDIAAKEKNRKGFQERQRRKLDLYEARQKAEDAQRETQELRKRLDALERGEKPAQRTESQESELPEHLQKEPDPDDFDTHAAYTRAVARHEHAIIKWEDEQATVKSRVSERQTTVKTKLSNAVQDALGKYDDFEDLTDGQPQRATPAVIEFIETMDDALIGELLYYFGQNPDEYDKIVKSGPIAAAKALTKIEGKLEALTPPAKKASKTNGNPPPPLKALGGTSGRKTSAIDDPKSTYRDIRKELIALKRR